ncbi:MAG TPA: glycoside hydrolase family 2 TIM barrel-domain containing protein, partial [Spirochaetia bacterium]|nr:glycoside hydrolase family 2 TIM barrel-domain containing protein [Spirochaetia bacterium]
YTPASFDITDSLTAGENVVVVRCEDLPGDEQPCGKQDRGAHQPYCFAATSGIWQPVWLEPVGEVYLESCRISADAAGGAFRLTPHVSGNQQGLRLTVRAIFAGRPVGELTIPADGRDEPLALTERHLWSPKRPDLYDIEMNLSRGDDLVDSVRAYTGLRDLAIDGRRILLNGKPIYQRQVLDQGYWPDGIYTAPTDTAIRADVEWTRRLGFNGVRKHQKIEDPRWLYWCDRLGLLVWEEMPAFNEDTPRSRERLCREWHAVIARDINHPCVVAWVPFNESFGIRDIDTNPSAQDFVVSVVQDTRALDTTRPVVDNSGWSHVDTDIADTHNYDPAGSVFLESWRKFHTGEDPGRRTSIRSWNGSYGGREWYGAIYPRQLFVPGRKYSGQPIMVSEWGGFFLRGLGQVAPILERRRGIEPNEEAFLARYGDMITAFDALPDLMGDCWTQLTDIEDEPNGLLSEARQPKVNVERIRRINCRRFEV